MATAEWDFSTSYTRGVMSPILTGSPVNFVKCKVSTLVCCDSRTKILLCSCSVEHLGSIQNIAYKFQYMPLQLPCQSPALLAPGLAHAGFGGDIHPELPSRPSTPALARQASQGACSRANSAWISV